VVSVFGDAGLLARQAGICEDKLVKAREHE
jgi:hypothetical protein